MKIKIVLVFLLITSSVSSQENNVLGFYCGYSGSGTVVVKNVSDLLFHKNYNAIRGLLYSKVPAENFLGVIVCKRLAYDKKLTLTPADLTKIEELLKSREKVQICGGCTYHEEVELSKLLHSQEEITSTNEYFFELNDK